MAAAEKEKQAVLEQVKALNAARRLLWAFIVTAGFMLIEAVGGKGVATAFGAIAPIGLDLT
ncbi:hypothetical protein FK513_29525, partial [Klebsiella pneumoniae]|nr:hypothetical protein [Klebsiella pneumoniae]